ncbi:interleukin-3 precursor [Cricetulus griseus]|nr:interleukin-3 precursor [Cricetulus griseus]
MALASSTTSILSRLLLLLMLSNQGLQSPLKSPDTCHLTSEEPYPLNCSLIATEIMGKLPEINITEVDVKAILRNKTLQRVNLCEFLKMRMNLEKEKLEEEKSKLEAIKCNLEKLEYCLKAPVSTSEMRGIYLNRNLTEFQTKLRFYVSQLNDLLPVPRPPHSSSDSVTSCPVAMECEKS